MPRFQTYEEKGAALAGRAAFPSEEGAAKDRRMRIIRFRSAALYNTVSWR
jgi:hypothetical protein